MKLFNIARHWFWLAPLVLGVAFIAGGAYMVVEGRNAHNDVRDTVVQEDITVSADAPSSQGEQIDSASAAQAQSDAILHHTLAATGGYLYAGLGQYSLPAGTYILPNGTYATPDGGTTQDQALAAKDANGKPVITTTDQAQAAKDASGKPINGWTSDKALAAKDANGNPVPNPLRTTALTSAELRTSLGVAVMGFKVSDLVVGMGVFMIFMGVTLALFLAPVTYYAAEIANERNREKARAHEVAPTTS